jgi:molybdenum cofactor guanylyltransferase
MSQIKARISTAFPISCLEITYLSPEVSRLFLQDAVSMISEAEPGNRADGQFSPWDIPRMEFAAALIAGGRSRRMGTDKALLTVTWRAQRMPLWKRQLAVLSELKPNQLMLSGPQRAGSPAIAVSDQWECAGPLAGIATCLDLCLHEFLLVLAVDVPKVESACLTQLLLRSANGCGVVPMRLGRYEPLIAVYPKKAFATAAARLDRRELKLQEFVGELVASKLVRPWIVPPQMEGQFVNWNSQGDTS